MAVQNFLNCGIFIKIRRQGVFGSLILNPLSQWARNHENWPKTNLQNFGKVNVFSKTRHLEVSFRVLP